MTTADLSEVERVAGALEKTRANMLGTADEAHYWLCHDASALLRSLAKEAERYRWLRDAQWLDEHVAERFAIDERNPETLDAAIDSAMARKEGGEG